MWFEIKLTKRQHDANDQYHTVWSSYGLLVAWCSWTKKETRVKRTCFPLRGVTRLINEWHPQSSSKLIPSQPSSHTGRILWLIALFLKATLPVRIHLSHLFLLHYFSIAMRPERRPIHFCSLRKRKMKHMRGGRTALPTSLGRDDITWPRGVASGNKILFCSVL